MKKIVLQKKGKVMVGVISIAILAIIMGVGVFAYQSYEKQKQIAHYENEIATIQKNFTNETEHQEKLDILQSLQKDYKKYKKSEKVFEEVSKDYEKAIDNMKQYFVEEYDKVISENTISDIDTTNDKEIINASITNLKNLLVMISDEKGIVCEKEAVDKYKTDIETLITSYTTRVAELEKQEKLTSYDSIIAENTIADIASNSDKDKISTAIDTLKTLLETIKTDAICDANEIASYEAKIGELTSSYEARLVAIEEEKAKALAEKEKENSSKNNSGNGNKSNNSNSNSNSGNRNNSSSGNSGGSSTDNSTPAPSAQTEQTPTRVVYTDTSQMDTSRPIARMGGYCFYIPSEVLNCPDKQPGSSIMYAYRGKDSEGNPLMAFAWVDDNSGQPYSRIYVGYCDGTLAYITD